MQNKPRSGLIAALDVGTSKVCCLIARSDAEGQARVIGASHQVSKGLKGGVVVDMDSAAEVITSAVHTAEQKAGETVHDVVVNLSGGRPHSRTVGVEVSISGHEVGENDLRRVLEQTTLLHHGGAHGASNGNGHGAGGIGVGNGQDGRPALATPPGGSRAAARNGERDLIHSIPVGFAIDGDRGIRDPRGMYGDRLGVRMHMITAATGAVRTLKTVIERCHLDVKHFVVSPYAAGLACLVEDEMDLGVTLIDMGAGATGITVFYDGAVVYADSVPVGGGHVTTDIARCLSTPLAHAERLKSLYGSAVGSAADAHDLIDAPQVGEDADSTPNHVSRSMLNQIIQPRVEEIFTLVRQRLEHSGTDAVAGRRVVLTGGASQLQGTRELGSLMLDKQVRMGRPLRVRGLADAMTGPAFTTCVGLIGFAANNPAALPEPTSVLKGELGGLPGRLGQWLREHI